MKTSPIPSRARNHQGTSMVRSQAALPVLGALILILSCVTGSIMTVSFNGTSSMVSSLFSEPTSALSPRARTGVSVIGPPTGSSVLNSSTIGSSINSFLGGK